MFKVHLSGCPERTFEDEFIAELYISGMLGGETWYADGVNVVCCGRNIGTFKRMSEA